MALVQELPTEILCAIFEQSVPNSTICSSDSSQLPHATESHYDSSTSRSRTQRGDMESAPTEPVAFCAIPSQKDSLAQSMALSQVCMRWRDIAIDLQSLWTRIHLGHNAFVRHDNDDSEATEMTARILSRSGRLALYLDVSFTLDDPLVLSSWIQKARYEKNIKLALLSHVERCVSLRLVSNDIINTAVLDVFLEHNLSSHSNYSTLSQLHLKQTNPSNQSENSGHGLPTFPHDLSLVAPHLTTLYVNGAQISIFPRWRLHSLSLNHTFMPYETHFHMFMKTRMTKLVLHRVTIPGGLPYIRRLTSHHLSSVTSLVLSELRCDGAEAEQEDIYTLFFVLSLYHSLRELELNALCRKAMVGLHHMLRANTMTIFEELRILTLRKVELEIMVANAVMNAFPSVDSLILDQVDGGSKLVFDHWKMRPEVWPQLSEITLNSAVVKRN